PRLHARERAAHHVQIGAADGARRQPHDRIGRLLQLRVAYLLDADIADAVENDCPHIDLLACTYLDLEPWTDEANGRRGCGGNREPSSCSRPAAHGLHGQRTRRSRGGSHMAEARNRPARDPVCGMQADEREPAAKASFEGRDYYFCSQSCKEKFE